MTTGETPPKPKKPLFVAIRSSPIVMRGAEFICRACSHSMAARIANALNLYQPPKGPDGRDKGK